MVSEKDFETLDHYVGNRLNAQEKAAFEQQLANNAELQQALTVQEQIAGGLRKARAAELKQMLKNVPVSALPTQPSLLGRIGLWAAAAGVAGSGLYFYLNQDDAKAVPATSPTTEIKQDATAVEPAPQAEAVQVPAETPSNALNKTEPVAPKTATDKTEEKTTERNTIEVYDPGAETENSNASTTTTEESPRASTRSTIVAETDATNKKYNFHYQFREGKLFLYGTFEKNLYEIMEFFADNKRTMFLYYKDNYYLLNDESDKVKSLTPIKDPALVKRLNASRGH
ncbi:MAG TPA: hypothetical protein VIU12_12615 [Chryseolinea sp.]